MVRCTLSLCVPEIEKGSFEELKIGFYTVRYSEGIVWSGLFDIEYFLNFFLKTRTIGHEETRREGGL